MPISRDRSLLALLSLASLACFAGCSASPATSATGGDPSPGLEAGAATDASGLPGNPGASGDPGDDAGAGAGPPDSSLPDAASSSDGAGGTPPSFDAASFDANVPDALPPSYAGTPFGGTAQTIPGTISLARYDLGGEGVAYHDTGKAAAPYAKCGITRSDGVNLDCTDTRDLAFPSCAAETAGEVYLAYLGSAEWFNYTVVVEEAGTYVIAGHIASASPTTKVSFAFSPTIGIGSIALPSNVGCSAHEAYHNWSDASGLAEIALTPGRYVMTLTILNQGLNLGSFTFTKK